MSEKFTRHSSVVAMAKAKENSKRKVDLDESGNSLDYEEQLRTSAEGWQLAICEWNLSPIMCDIGQCGMITKKPRPL